MNATTITPAEQAAFSKLRKELEDEAEKLFEQNQIVERKKMKFQRKHTELARKYRLRSYGSGETATSDQIDDFGAIIRAEKPKKEKP